MLTLFIIFFLTRSIFSSIPVIVTTIDGTIYALEETSGNILWKFPTNEPLTKSFGSVPIVASLDGSLYRITTDGILEVC